jgi:hypothetical protein
MYFDLKPISAESIPEALAKVERYRLLNEPSLAESICLDILTVAPDHQQALISLLLTRTDQFGLGVTAESAREVLSRIRGDYERAYYGGIIWERVAHLQFREGRTGGGAAVYDSLRKAMAHYERAEAVRTPGNDDAILRWNTCARIIMRRPEILPQPDYESEPIMSE